MLLKVVNYISDSACRVKRAKNLDAKYIACERAFVYYGSS